MNVVGKRVMLPTGGMWSLCIPAVRHSTCAIVDGKLSQSTSCLHEQQRWDIDAPHFTCAQLPKILCSPAKPS